jgi:hypothetical protein
MLVAFWSAKGGSGTSVFTAACALVLARDARESGRAGGVRVADLAGDLPAILGLNAEPDLGVADWLQAGPEAPTDALDRLLVEAAPGVGLLPCGDPGRVWSAAPEAGAALAVALGHGAAPTLIDCGTARDPAARAVVEVADVAVLVLRGCYVGLRRAVHSPAIRHTTAAVFMEEPGRSLSASDASDVLDVPVVVRLPVKPQIGRAVDAGVLASRLPEPLARAASTFVQRLAAPTGRRGRAA